MKTLLTFIFLICLASCNNAALIDVEDTQKNLTKACEEAYFEGQRDVINGDIRIQFRNDSCWHWIKSPWNDGTAFTFDPITKPGRK